MDLSLYEDNRFVVTHYEDAWLGEQGKKLGASFTGLDDYDLVLLKYINIPSVLAVLPDIPALIPECEYFQCICKIKFGIHKI